MAAPRTRLLPAPAMSPACLPAAPRLLPAALLLAALAACAGAPSEEVSGQSDLSGATTLLVHYPANGHTVSIRGSEDGLDWNGGVPAQTQDGQTFSVTISHVEGTLQWKPLLDDQTWSLGPNYAARAGETVEIWPRFYVDQGTVTRIDNWWSNTLQNNRPIYIYTPPSYVEQTSLSFPVIYMHDGQNLFDAYAGDSFSGTTWSVDTALDQGAADGSIREAIVVGIGNTDNRTWEYTPNDSGEGDTGGGASQYLGFIVDELKPQIDGNERTLGDRGDTLMIGSSLGGLATGCAGLWQAGVFGSIGVLSPSTWWANEWITAQVDASSGQDPKPARVYVDSGDSGPSNDDVTYTQALAQAYQSNGYSPVDYQVGHGDQHDEAAWARRLPGALQFLLGPRAALP